MSSTTNALEKRGDEAKSKDFLKFPGDFLWGTATSSTQIEGHITNEWTDIVARDGNTCHIACDSYHRYPEDVEWMVKLGVNAYRMGIEWSLLQPGPFAPLDQRELARYRDVLDRLNAAGIVPMVVLHHFSNPTWISSTGGWVNLATVDAFVDYAGKLVSALRGRVRFWNTFNEPDTYAACGYLVAEFPPFLRFRFDSFLKVISHMAEAHVRICQLIRPAGTDRKPLEVGFSKNWAIFKAFSKRALWDRSLAALGHFLFNRLVLDAFLGNGRSKESTFLGVNYYGRIQIRNGEPLSPAARVSRTTLDRWGIVCDDMFERHPPGMECVLKDLYAKYHLPIYVTEHGSASENEEFRIRDLKENLNALHRALENGADVRGFFYWSLLDNFEWRFGYSKKFGLIKVDFTDENLPRTMKPTGNIYRQICSENALRI